MAIQSFVIVSLDLSARHAPGMQALGEHAAWHDHPDCIVVAVAPEAVKRARCVVHQRIRGQQAEFTVEGGARAWIKSALDRRPPAGVVFHEGQLCIYVARGNAVVPEQRKPPGGDSSDGALLGEPQCQPGTESAGERVAEAEN